MTRLSKLEQAALARYMRISLAIITALLTFGAVCQPVLAAEDTPPVCPITETEYKGNNPRVQHGSVDYRGHAYKYMVLLPSDYATSRRSYPVLYWLHGVGGGENDLFTTDTPNFIEDLTDGEPVIVVAVDGGFVGMYADWPGDDGKQFESVHTGSLIRHIDATYRTVADRRHRAVAGLSMGAFGAMNYAQRHPDLFGVVGSFSGLPDISPMTSPVSSSFATSFVATFPAGCMGGMKPFGPFGDPVTNQATWREYNAAANVERFRATVVYTAVGNGTPCDEADVETLVKQNPTRTLEPFFRESNVSFHRAMRSAGVPMTFDDYGCGIHGWRYWEHDFKVFWPLMRAAFDRYPPRSATPARLRVSLARRQRVLRQGGVRVAARCAQACRLTSTGIVGLGRRPLRLGPTRRSLRRAASARLLLRLTSHAESRLRRALSRRAQVRGRIRVTATTSAGSVRVTRFVTLIR
jgi:S-formylglutathione hydrolase FrmB